MFYNFITFTYISIRLKKNKKLIIGKNAIYIKRKKQMNKNLALFEANLICILHFIIRIDD